VHRHAKFALRSNHYLSDLIRMSFENSLEDSVNKCAQSFLFKLLLVLVCMALWGPAAAAQTTPTPGQNINIASGTVQLKDPSTDYVTILGDPFLQRQNEPSIAVSTINPLHLLAGGNDYRAVDIPFPDVLPSKLVGDAWCGLFMSTDGGLRWQSTLLPGFPQDNKPLGRKSPLYGYKACSDATVRPGPGGMFYYSGIAFNRDTNQSVVFVARFLDRNYAEKGNVALNTAAIQYVDTVVVDTGTTGQFIDKTWNAVLLQPGTGTCSIPVPVGMSATQTQSVPVPAMTVYVVWSRFTGSTSSKIMITQSQNCGGTYGALFKVSESNSINQGTVVAVNQPTAGTLGDVFLAWRRFGISKTQPDAIMAVKCVVSLKSCSKTIDVTANLPTSSIPSDAFSPFKPFDQQSTKTTFRTNSMPAMAVSVDASGKSQVHIAFAARNGLGDAKILLATSSDGLTWPQSQIQPVEPGPIKDDNLVDWGIGGRGHQLMPAMTFTEGKLVIAYYFSHFDHTVGLYQPNASFTPVDPITGKFFKEFRDPRNELLSDPDSVYSNDIINGVRKSLNDSFMVTRRHTLDVRMAQADVNDLSFPNPSAHAMVSRYVFGMRNSSIAFEDYQANPPDLPLFANGGLAFVGDYIDVAGSMFVPCTGTGCIGPWKANDAPSKSSVHHVVWTDNRDVQPPLVGDYSNFTSLRSVVGADATSFFDGSTVVPCRAGQAGMRDQNIYISPITQGFVFSVPQNMKPLGTTTRTLPDGSITTILLDRAFTALLSNSIKDPLKVRLEIMKQPSGGRASFVQSGAELTCQGSSFPCIDVTVPAHSGLARAIFVNSSISGLVSGTDVSVQVTATATQIDASGSPVLGGFSASSSVVLNAPNTVTTLLQPEGVALDPMDITKLEAYNGSLKSGSLKSGSLKSGSLKSGSLKSGSLKSGSLKSGSLKSGSLKSGSLKSTSIADLTCTGTTCPSDITTNSNEVDSSVSATCTATDSPTVTDAIYVLSNEGNTIATYTISLVGVLPAGTPTCPAPVQLIIAQPGVAFTSQGCELIQQDDTIVLANITDFTNLTDLKVSVPPNESLLVSIRGASIDIVENATDLAAPQAAPPANSDGTQTTTEALRVDCSDPSCKLTDVATVGVAYSTALQAAGGTTPIAPITASGAVRASNLVTITTTAAHGYMPGQSVMVSGVTDTSFNSTFTILSVPSTSTFTYAQTGPNATSGNGSVPALTYTWGLIDRGTLPLDFDLTLASSTGQLTGTPTAAGTFTFKVQVCDANLPTITACDSSAPFDSSARKTLTLTVNKADTTTAVTNAANPSVYGQAVAFTATVSAAPPSTSPPPTLTGTVQFVVDGLDFGGPVALAGGMATSGSTSSLSVGPHTVSASYSGDSNFKMSTSPNFTQTVTRADTTTTITADTPDPSIVGQGYTVSWNVTVVAPGAGNPTGPVTVDEGSGASCSAPLAAGSCVLTSTTAGTKTLTASYSGDANYNGSSGTASHVVNKVDTTTAIKSDLPDPSIVGQPVPVSFTVTPNISLTVIPPGNVTVSDGTDSCTASVSAGSCSLTLTTVGTRSLTASYVGDSNFNSSTSAAEPHQVFYKFVGFFSPNATAGTETSPSDSGTANFGSAIPLKFQLKDFNGISISDVNTVVIQAVFNGNPATSCSGLATGPSYPIFSPTTGAAGNSTFRWDPNNQQFIVSWDSSSAAVSGKGCYSIQVQPKDGSPIKATYKKLI
jgi:hypothetical protein